MIYDQAEVLFGAIGRRLGDGVTTHLTLRELRDSEKRYRALVDNATEAIVIFDLDSNLYVDANPAAARFFGIPVEELIGSRGPAGFAPEFQPDGMRSVEKAALKMGLALAGEFPSFEWVQLRPDGEEMPCHASLSRFPDPTRRLIRGNMVDITERKKSEKERAILQSQLAQAQKLEAVGQMTGGVAHDFNNLLSVILGNLELLRDGSPRAEAVELIDPAIKATMRGGDLTRKMLSFARRAHLEPTVLNLNEIVRDMDNWMRRTLTARIDVRVSLAEGLWPVEADLASTESALLNLVINARDAMSEGGLLTITTENREINRDSAKADCDELLSGRYVMLMVSDTGIGMGKDELEKVFEPFFTTKRMTESSGLGLSMVHGFMRQSGGSVHIETEPGAGSSVRLFFKAQVQPETVAGVAKAEQPPKAESSGRVLLAEDQQAVADILVRILENKGYHVVIGKSGDAALDLFRTEGPFDMLLTDIVMPGTLQGPALAKALREIEPDLPVVFMSGYASEENLTGDGLREDDIRLMKPVSRALLLDSVREALERKA